jgi:F-type H+-transporting ATPase subunit gamma
VHLLVVMTSERGLAGAFNSSIARMARAEANRLLRAGKTVRVLTVGKKGRDALRRDLSAHMIAHVDLSGEKRMGYELASRVGRDLIARFEAGEFDVATIFFSRFQSVISQIPTMQQVIPATFEDAGGVSRSTTTSPARRRSSGAAAPRGRHAGLRGAPRERRLEQGARMSAMDNATRNAGDMIDRLTIQYNRSRQAAITKELIEIISGAEAL